MSVIPATWEAEIEGLWFEAIMGKEQAITINKLGLVVHICCNPSYAGGIVV
jgi:hypothetical protein